MTYIFKSIIVESLVIIPNKKIAYDNSHKLPRQQNTKDLTLINILGIIIHAAIKNIKYQKYYLKICEQKALTFYDKSSIILKAVFYSGYQKDIIGRNNYSKFILTNISRFDIIYSADRQKSATYDKVFEN